MSTNAGPLLQRVQDSFQRLSALAADLNAASDDLGQTIGTLEEALKRLNLGVFAQVKFFNTESDDGLYYSYHQLEYGKVAGKWGIIISSYSGRLDDEDDKLEKSWLFNDAPRQLRLASVEFIPELIDNLADEAEKVRERVVATNKKVQELATALMPKSKFPPGHPSRPKS